MDKWGRCYNKKDHHGSGHSEDVPNAMQLEVGIHKHTSGVLGNFTVFILRIIYEPLWATVCHTNERCCKKS